MLIQEQSSNQNKLIMETISFCKHDELAKLQMFIHEKWSKNHILSNNLVLLNFQHKSEEYYNFIISTNNSNELSSILGFIPISQFDANLELNKDIWLAIWKVDEVAAKPGIGYALLKWLEKEFKPKTIGAIGINKEVLKIYKALNYKTGILNQYYILNTSIKKFRIAKIFDKKSSINGNNTTELSEISFTQIEQFNFIGKPSKSIKYLENRYLKHPYFNYFFIGAFNEKKIIAVFVLRKIEVNGTSCLRILDILGEYSKIGFVGSEFQVLLAKHQSEYIDCLNFGLSEQQFFDWGFQLQDGINIIPNYFEPFIQNNVDVIFAFKSEYPDYLIFKGDSDQDRPNVILNE